MPPKLSLASASTLLVLLIGTSFVPSASACVMTSQGTETEEYSATVVAGDAYVRAGAYATYHRWSGCVIGPVISLVPQDIEPILDIGLP